MGGRRESLGEKGEKRKKIPSYALSLKEVLDSFLFKLVSDEKLVLFKENQTILVRA